MTININRNSKLSKAALFPELAPQEVTITPKLWAGLRKTGIDPKPHTITRQGNDSEVRVTTLSFHNIHEYGNLFTNYLKARREVFIVHRGWVLPEVDGMEFDQYDTPLSRWIVLHEYGEVLAGIRLTPTTAQCAQYSYMIRDAQRGLLNGIPRDLLFLDAPVKDHVWEATRLFVSSRVSAKRRMRIQTILMLEMSRSARALGVSYIIGIVPAIFHRWMKRIGMSAFPVGPILEIDCDQTQAAMMDIRQSES